MKVQTRKTDVAYLIASAQIAFVSMCQRDRY